MQIAPGTLFGPYQILALIGAGGMGQVYRARDTRLERQVAIKVISASAAGNDAALERFQREARAIAALTHPHICTLYDVGRERTSSSSSWNTSKARRWPPVLGGESRVRKRSLRHADATARAGGGSTRQLGCRHRRREPASLTTRSSPSGRSCRMRLPLPIGPASSIAT